MSLNPTKKLKLSAATTSSPTIVNLLSQGPSQYPINEPNEYTPVFYSEISDIMRGFGDSAKPLRESVTLVEKILCQQLRGIMQEIFDISTCRKGKCLPSRMDFEFLMRKHPIKIARLRKHLRDMRLQKKYEDLSAGRVTQDLFDPNNDNSDEDHEAEEELELYDEEKVRRLFRADRISQILTGDDYAEYNVARRVSFNCRNSQAMRTRMRIFLNVPMDIPLSSITLIILAYLAHETIATIVDFCILSRLNSSNRISEPYTRVTTPGTYYDMLHLCPEVTQGRGQDGAKPITVQEINEAMRRFTQSATQNMGSFRNGRPVNEACFLAI